MKKRSVVQRSACVTLYETCVCARARERAREGWGEGESERKRDREGETVEGGREGGKRNKGGGEAGSPTPSGLQRCRHARCSSRSGAGRDEESMCALQVGGYNKSGEGWEKSFCEAGVMPYKFRKVVLHCGGRGRLEAPLRVLAITEGAWTEGEGGGLGGWRLGGGGRRWTEEGCGGAQARLRWTLTRRC